MPKKHLGLLLTGLAAGDSLGSTSAYHSREEVLALYEEHKDEGWPFCQVGKGRFRCSPGQPTDCTEMASCMVRSYLDNGGFDPEELAKSFVLWAKTGPRDIGATTVRGIGSLALGRPWFESGLEEFTTRPASATNGSLMRNGVVPGMTDDLGEAFRISLYQGIMTHYGPLPVLCCAMQTYLIWKLLGGSNVLEESWAMDFWTSWLEWYENMKDDEIVDSWSTFVTELYPQAYKALSEVEFDPDRYNPLVYSPTNGAGNVLTTLKTAIWGLYWSMTDRKFQAPVGWPEEVFEKRGPWVLGWVALAGGDTSAYCATAGPMIAAAHGSLPDEMIEHLEVFDEFSDLWPQPASKSKKKNSS